MPTAEVLAWTLALLSVVVAGRSFDERLSDSRRRALLVKLRAYRLRLTPTGTSSAFARCREGVVTLFHGLWPWPPRAKHSLFLVVSSAIYVLVMALCGRALWGSGASYPKIALFVCGGFVTQLWVDDLGMRALRSRLFPARRVTSAAASALSGTLLAGGALAATLFVAWSLTMSAILLGFESRDALGAMARISSLPSLWWAPGAWPPPLLSVIIIAVTTRLVPLALGLGLLASAGAHGLRRLPREVLHWFTHRGAPADALKRSFTPLKFLGDVSALSIAFVKLVETTITILRS